MDTRTRTQFSHLHFKRGFSVKECAYQMGLDIERLKELIAERQKADPEFAAKIKEASGKTTTK